MTEPDAVRAYRALERAHIDILPMIGADDNSAIYRAWDMLQQAMDGLWWSMSREALDILQRSTEMFTKEDLSQRVNAAIARHPAAGEAADA